jgi:hypothetical protein
MILKLSAVQLKKLSIGKRDALIREAHRKVNGSVDAYYAAIEGKIRTYEVTSGMKSALMVRRWRTGKLEETPEVSHWLYYIKARNERKAPKPSRANRTK